MFASNVFDTVMLRISEMCLGLKYHFYTPTPYLVILFTLMWSFVYLVLSPHILRCFLPKLTYKKLLHECKTRKDLYIQSCINATAFIHAAIISLAVLAVLLFCESIQVDLFHAKPIAFQILALVMCGYFLWDALICLKYKEFYGLTFILHALVSLSVLYYQTNKTEHVFAKFLLIFMGTEVSTPLLHFRWFLSTAKQTDTRLFKTINIFFLLCFVYYRLYFCVRNAVIPFFKLAFFETRDLYITNSHRFFIALSCFLWMFLNVYWGCLLFKSQRRHIRSKLSHD